MPEMMELEQIAERLNGRLAETRRGYDGHVSHLVAELLDETSREIYGFGEEGTLDAEKGINIQYINMGDAYNLTIFYDGAQNRFFASTWADVMERYEAEYEARRENEEERILGIVETLNGERRSEELWIERHGRSTVEEVMEDILGEFGGERVLEIYDRSKDIELLYVDRRNDPDNTLVYDAVLDVFTLEKVPDVTARKEREYEIEHVGFENITRRLNRELGESGGQNGRERSEVRDMLRGFLYETKGKRVAESDSGRIMYIERREKRTHTIFYDAEADKFIAGDFNTSRDERNREMNGREADNASGIRGSDDEARDAAGMEVLHAAAREGVSVYIGDEEYYVRSTNRFFANLYPMKDIDAFPWIIDGRPIDWDALKKDPYSLASEIRSNDFMVTDYFLDINDFRDAVIGNTRNAALIERMGLSVPERDNPLIPILQTDASPYYATGDRVYIDEDRPAEILAVGNRRVWYSYDPEDPKSVITKPMRNFDDYFYYNPLNKDAIERAGEIERSGEKQFISSVNLPVLT